ncbi:MAG: glycoside hydrolase family 27 protein [Terracidiphilus sp.]|jgi:hypothetical protein
MGWNSWDAYAITIDEAQFKANAAVLASLRQYGWQYAVIDAAWYMQDPFASGPKDPKPVWNANGLLLPAVNRFPSAADGAGFKALADWAHAQGLKFGFHIMHGMLRQIAKENLPIAGSSFHTADAADPSDSCSWASDYISVRDNAAGRAYYDSMFKLYASWGIDFVKVDCIAARPSYRPTEIRQIASAIKKSGRAILLSLSPGETSLEDAAVLGKYGQMWRITADHWDYWRNEKHPGEYPSGILDAFDRLAKWAQYAKPGNWPDPDILPWGSLTPVPGEGEPRQSRETKDEQITEFTLVAISRSPLMLGTNLTKLDPLTRELITNKEVLAIGQNAVRAGQTKEDENDPLSPRYWWAVTRDPGAKHYLAIFNVSDKARDFDVPWTSFHLTRAKYAVYDMWNNKQLFAARILHAGVIPPHGCALYRVQ